MRTALAAMLASVPALVGQEDAPKRPNVVVFLADDQGFGDFGHAGHPVLETPNLDRLADESPQVERFYVSPVCSPTRASLMTGRYAYRTGVVDTWIGRSMMRTGEVTLAEVLRDAGYATGIFGKWHLGDCHPMRPQDQGFDEVLVHRGGGLAQPSEPPRNEGRYTDPVLFDESGGEVEAEGFCTDVYVDAALAFMERSRREGRPFFAYVPTNAPHGPFGDVPEELRQKYAALGGTAGAVRDPGDRRLVDREARICAMVENNDRNVGRLLRWLEESGEAADTVFVYFNDNGPVGGRFTNGLRGHKGSVHEGGIRSPLFVRWPGRLDPDTRVAGVVAHLDLLPTILELCGVRPEGLPQLDGLSLVPRLMGRRDELRFDERTLVLQAHRGDAPGKGHNAAVLRGRWKLVRASGFGAREKADEPWRLFDLVADPGERVDLADEETHVFARMRAAYDAWWDSVCSGGDFDPPAIVLGTDAEPRTVLTRQDWRVTDGRGWGNAGWWAVEASEPVRFDVTVYLTAAEGEPVPGARLDLTLGDDGPLRLELGAGSRVGDVFRYESPQPLVVPAGRFALRASAVGGVLGSGAAPRARAVHQLVLTRRP